MSAAGKKEESMYRSLIGATLKQIRGRVRELLGLITGNEMEEIKGRCEYILARVDKRITIEKLTSRELGASFVY
jgi:uncharacterized protein YjbJ (UPF0337 family)